MRLLQILVAAILKRYFRVVEIRKHEMVGVGRGDLCKSKHRIRSENCLSFFPVLTKGDKNLSVSVESLFLHKLFKHKTRR